MHGFAKFPDGFPAARILLEWKDYPQIAQGFMSRSDVQPVRSRRGEEAFEEDGAGEAGGRDGAGQIVEEVAETGNLAKDMAARILSAEAESEDAAARQAAQRLEARGDQMSPAVHAANKATAVRGAGEANGVRTRSREEGAEGQG